jgi:thiamine phosphate synthase YjbQ (UPF0047 family)
MVSQFSVETRGQGLYEITAKVQAVLEDSGVEEGLCTIFVRHTSASLVIQENADPSAKHDLERWIARLALGTWQGIYLWEHRRRGAARELVLHIGT